MTEEAAQKEEKRVKQQQDEIAIIQKIKQKVQAEHEEFKEVKDDDFVGFFKLYSKIQSDTRHYFDSNRQWKNFFRLHDSYLRQHYLQMAIELKKQGKTIPEIQQAVEVDAKEYFREQALAKLIKNIQHYKYLGQE